MAGSATAVRPEWWLPKHVNELVRELKKALSRRIQSQAESRRRGKPVVEAHQTKDLKRQGGNTEGNAPPREVFPLDWPASRIRPGQRMRFARGERIPQLQIVVQVAARRFGRRSVPPAWWRHYWSGRQQRYRGVSDHAK
jgi:hypothetical protein